MRASTRKGQLSIIHHVISFLHIEPLEFQYSVLNLRKLKNYDHTELCIICIIFIFMFFLAQNFLFIAMMNVHMQHRRENITWTEYALRTLNSAVVLAMKFALYMSLLNLYLLLNNKCKRRKHVIFKGKYQTFQNEY